MAFYLACEQRLANIDIILIRSETHKNRFKRNLLRQSNYKDLDPLNQNKPFMPIKL